MFIGFINGRMVLFKQNHFRRFNIELIMHIIWIPFIPLQIPSEGFSVYKALGEKALEKRMPTCLSSLALHPKPLGISQQLSPMLCDP